MRVNDISYSVGIKIVALRVEVKRAVTREYHEVPSRVAEEARSRAFRAWEYL